MAEKVAQTGLGEEVGIGVAVGIVVPLSGHLIFAVASFIGKGLVAAGLKFLQLIVLLVNVFPSGKVSILGMTVPLSARIPTEFPVNALLLIVALEKAESKIPAPGLVDLPIFT